MSPSVVGFSAHGRLLGTHAHPGNSVGVLYRSRGIAFSFTATNYLYHLPLRCIRPAMLADFLNYIHWQGLDAACALTHSSLTAVEPYHASNPKKKNGGSSLNNNRPQAVTGEGQHTYYIVQCETWPVLYGS